MLTYKSTIEHTATVIICKKNPNESEGGISCRVKMLGPGTYQGICRTGANRRKDSEEPGWSKQQ